ncbi:MAG: hypothetical protein C4542_08160 [Dehalococcoidia bacterium]|nr:MAG: hypothetical protein C4542_08160 [Dehalococcoidia bacterium]
MIPRNLINSALRAINAIGANEVPTNDMFEDARELLNMLLDSWSAEELLPHDYVQTSFDLLAAIENYTIVDGAEADADGICVSQAVSGASTLTINGVGTGSVTVASGVATMDYPRHVSVLSAGANTAVTMTVVGTNTYGDAISEVITMGGNGVTTYGVKQFKTVTSVTSSGAASGNVSVGSDAIIDIRRPIKIVSAFCRTSAGVDTPVLIASRERFNEIRDKDEAGTPTKLYYDRLYPSGEIYIHPTPAAAGTHDLHLDLWLPFVTISASSVDTDINLPSEYLLAFRWNLAAELAPEYGKNVTEFVFARAAETKNVIRMLNSMPPKPLSMASPIPLVNNQPAFNKN